MVIKTSGLSDEDMRYGISEFEHEISLTKDKIKDYRAELAFRKGIKRGFKSTIEKNETDLAARTAESGTAEMRIDVEGKQLDTGASLSLYLNLCLAHAFDPA